MNSRSLSEEETLFVAEAERGYFGVCFDDAGAPYAMGVVQASRLFSMEVIEIDDPLNNGSIYVLPDQTPGEQP